MGGAQGGDGVGGSAEADIPEDKFVLVRLEAFDEAELADIERLGFGDGADDGMEGFVMGEGMDAVGAIGKLNDPVCGGGLHEETFGHGTAEAKLKEWTNARRSPGPG